SAARTGSASAIATWRFMSSERGGCGGGGLSPPPPPPSCPPPAAGPPGRPRQKEHCGPERGGGGGWSVFQVAFFRLRCRPVVRELAFEGAEDARPHPDLLAVLRDERLRAVIICPSNPFISVEPILAVPGMREALCASAAPVIAVSPIIGGRAVKGPTAKMMAELGMTPSAAAVAERYGDLLDGYVMDIADAEEAGHVAAKVTLAPTLMTTLAEREALARTVLEAADVLVALK